MKVITNENKGILNEGAKIALFSAPWCGPCRMMKPIYEELSKEYEGKVSLCAINVDEMQELAAEYGVRSIPSIFSIKDGQIIDQFVGPQTKETLIETIKRVI